MLCDAETPWGVSWTSDNTILYGQSDDARTGAAGIWRVSGEGGKPEHVVKVEAGQIAGGPQLLPGGRAILFTLAARLGEWDTAQIIVQSLDSDRRHVVVERGTDARYVPTGHLVYALDETLLAVPFDVTRFAVTGDAVPLVEDVAQQGGTAHFAISNQGTLVYVPSDAIAGLQRPRTLVWVDRQGHEVPIKGVSPRMYFYPRLSPDGTRVALDVRDEAHDIWIWHLAPRERLERLTLEPTFEEAGVWGHDGKTVIYASSRRAGAYAPRSLFRRPSDGSGTAEQLTQGTVTQVPSTVTPDGSALIFRVQTPRAKVGTSPAPDLYLLPLAGEHRSRPLLAAAPFDELNAEVSPNGQWLAYESNESGRREIHVRPFPNVEANRQQVSINGGTQPLWARNGQELFYESMGTLMRVPVKTGATFERGTPEKVFDRRRMFVRPLFAGPGRMYDVSADGQQFLMIKETGVADERPPSARIVLVQNWFEELKRLVPTK